MELSIDNVEELLRRDLGVPLDLAPVALWHLVDPQGYTEEMFMPQSEEELGERF